MVKAFYIRKLMADMWDRVQLTSILIMNGTTQGRALDAGVLLG